MIRAKIRSIVICLGAVYTDPYWNLIGVVQSLLVRQAGSSRFFVYVGIGDLSSRQDGKVELSVEDPETDEQLFKIQHLIRGDEDGMGAIVFEVGADFSRDGVYNLSFKFDGSVLHVAKLRVQVLDQ